MAAAANTTGTLRDGEDSQGKPSIFELVSEQGFSHALRPAFLHIVKTLAERWPEGKIPFLYRNFDEFYLAFDTVVQWHYMVTRGATLSEAFYGLERHAIGKESVKILRLSYVLSVLLPYLKGKLNKLVKEAKENEEDKTENKFLKYLPYLKAILKALNLICLLRYSFGYSKSHNLLFTLLSLSLSYTSASRTRFVEEKRSEIWNSSSWSLKRFPILVLRSLGESVLFGVELGSFFVQFLDWWYNDPRRERVVINSLPVPPPLSEGDGNFIKVEEKGLCPLCRRRFKNATALATSGIVYCYGCISPYLKQNGSCPLTRIESRMDHLIRIFA